MAATHDRPVTPSTRAELDDLVASHDRVLVEFHTEGCGKCAAMEPVLSAVARSTEAVVATMNPRDDPELVDEYDVRSVPKLLLFVDGALAATREDGVLAVEEVQAFVADGD
ncbi:thioredoxin family protein [Halosimplex rubrum]|uniref:Thioredoxin family protein n=1 Tax=Halosimplex rubrum TaxID=869889 RepID=A0A7D5T6A8_9EURY|nr:thioredoxin family protein [Halosimplex rubrum]QLH77595.1 thioredoxin family protein [Halosimplex rubrum]